jgi:hypothetical protein
MEPVPFSAFERALVVMVAATQEAAEITAHDHPHTSETYLDMRDRYRVTLGLAPMPRPQAVAGVTRPRRKVWTAAEWGEAA